MTVHRWPMIAILPVALLGAFGVAEFAVAETADRLATCRQYIPSSGVTIAIECGPTVAAVIKASATVAPATCRRFVPSAQMSIEEPCPEPVAGGAIVRAAEPVSAGKGLPVAVPVEPSATGTTGKGKATAGKAPGKAAMLAGPVGSVPGGCAGIIERAQLGGETHQDLKALRSGCAPGG